jgi:hypothetical protein
MKQREESLVLLRCGFLFLGAPDDGWGGLLIPEATCLEQINRLPHRPPRFEDRGTVVHDPGQVRVREGDAAKGRGPQQPYILHTTDEGFSATPPGLWPRVPSW